MTATPEDLTNKVDEKISCARVWKDVTWSDDADFKIPAADGTEKFCRGFHVNVDGTMYITGVDPNSAVATKLVVKGGTYYPYSVRRFRATTTDAALKAAGAVIAAR